MIRLRAILVWSIDAAEVLILLLPVLLALSYLLTSW